MATEDEHIGLQPCGGARAAGVAPRIHASRCSEGGPLDSPNLHRCSRRVSSRQPESTKEEGAKAKGW